jgi:hypothetical protein
VAGRATRWHVPARGGSLGPSGRARLLVFLLVGVPVVAPAQPAASPPAAVAVFGQEVGRAAAHDADATDGLQDGAFADSATLALVERARARRLTLDRSILRYEALVQERMSAGLRLASRERLLYRREAAARIDWERGGRVHVDVLGAREAVPPALAGVQVPHGLENYIGHLAFDPVSSDMLVRLDGGAVRHPLAVEAADRYRYRTGDTTAIRLPDGRSVTLIELVVAPRRAAPDLIVGSLWLDAETAAVVRMVFRPSRMVRAGEVRPGGRRSPFALPARAELTFVAVEYGLWDLRWWMPRLIVAEGTIAFGSYVGVPLQYERRYGEYRVDGDPTPVAVVAVTDSALRAARPCRPPFRMVVSIGTPRDATAGGRTGAGRSDPTRADCLRDFRVGVPTDSASLLVDPHLPPAPFARGAGLLTADELAQIGRWLDGMPEVPWQLGPPRVALVAREGWALRYNRVEEVSLGLSATWDLGRAAVDGGARIGTGDGVPNLEAGVTRTRRAAEIRLGGFRRLASADPAFASFGLGNSLGALALASDNGDYYRAAGLELTIRPRGGSWDVRIHAERQSPVEVGTDFSLTRLLFDQERVFRPNIEAARADQVGVRVGLRTSRGLEPTGPRWAATASIHAATGTFDFVRPGLALRAAAPLPPRLMGAVELGVGASAGTVPVQSAWFVGGGPTVRGYEPATRVGDAYWRGRFELGTRNPLVRVVGFTDIGWAGSRGDIGRSRPLASGGLGLGVFDGLLRIDLVRALQAPAGWSAAVTFDARL